MRRPVLPGGPRSKIYHDLEVRQFLDTLLRHPLTLDNVREKVNAVFGDGRTPSRSAIGRYARRRRLEIGFDGANYLTGAGANT